MICLKCNGRGFVYNSEGVYGQGFAKREACDACDATGEEPYHDPTAKPILWLIAVFVAYMIWQFFIR